MREPSSHDQQPSGETQRAAEPSAPSAKLGRVIGRIPRKDPFGYDTTDLRQVALAMADAAESARNRHAVRAEIAAIERRWGLT